MGGRGFVKLGLLSQNTNCMTYLNLCRCNFCKCCSSSNLIVVTGYIQKRISRWINILVHIRIVCIISVHNHRQWSGKSSHCDILNFFSPDLEYPFLNRRWGGGILLAIISSGRTLKALTINIRETGIDQKEITDTQNSAKTFQTSKE